MGRWARVPGRCPPPGLLLLLVLLLPAPPPLRAQPQAGGVSTGPWRRTWAPCAHSGSRGPGQAGSGAGEGPTVLKAGSGARWECWAGGWGPHLGAGGPLRSRAGGV